MKKDTWTPEATAKLRELFDQGMSLRAIAKAMNVTKSMVTGKINRSDFPTRGAPTNRNAGAQTVRRKQLGAQAPWTAPVITYKPPILLPPSHCQWPTGEGKSIRFNCREAIVPGSSYCAAHRKVSIGLKPGATSPS